MKYDISIDTKGKIKLLALLFIFIIGVTVFQDYLYSRIQNTGFYLSESLIYNIFWLFFIPFLLSTNQLTKYLYPKNKLVTILYTLGIGVVFSFLHIIFFTFFYVFISNILFNPPHRFLSIFNAACANQFYVVFIFYTIVPFFYRLFLNRNQKIASSSSPTKYAATINLKIGLNIKTIKTSTIQAIATDKPYVIIHINNQKILQSKSLKDFERELDPTIFIRVHRSTIINSEFIKEIKSRKNGDYDAYLENGLSIRFSRHYRKNWLKLLQ